MSNHNPSEAYPWHDAPWNRGVRRSKRVEGARRTHYDGQKFDSKREAMRWGQLDLLEKSGEIAYLERQVKIPLMGKDGNILTPTGRHMVYIADFKYHDRRTGEWIYEDAKGFPTEVYKLKRAILAAQGVSIREV